MRDILLSIIDFLSLLNISSLIPYELVIIVTYLYCAMILLCQSYFLFLFFYLSTYNIIVIVLLQRRIDIERVFLLVCSIDWKSAFFFFWGLCLFLILVQPLGVRVSNPILYSRNRYSVCFQFINLATLFTFIYSVYFTIISSFGI